MCIVLRYCQYEMWHKYALDLYELMSHFGRKMEEKLLAHFPDNPLLVAQQILTQFIRAMCACEPLNIGPVVSQTLFLSRLAHFHQRSVDQLIWQYVWGQMHDDDLP